MSKNRRRGGQPGNRNAVTHGFYTRHKPSGYPPGSKDEKPVYEGLQEEIEIVRKYLHRLDQLGDLYTDNLSAIFNIIRGLHLATNSIARLTRLHDQLTYGREEDDSLALLSQAVDKALEEEIRNNNFSFGSPSNPAGSITPQPPYSAPPPYTPDPSAVEDNFSTTPESPSHDRSF